MANAALFEQMLMSGSTAMIFLTLDTGWKCQYPCWSRPERVADREQTHMEAELCPSPPCEA